MVWLLVFVVCGAVVLLGPVWREISEHITLGDLLEAEIFRIRPRSVTSVSGNCKRVQSVGE